MIVSRTAIAKKLHGNANEYMRIFDANKNQLKDPDRIFPEKGFKNSTYRR